MSTLPFRVWCECRHISGQHAITFPHRCTICDCAVFVSPAIDALTEFLTLRDEIAKLEHDCDPPEFTRCDRCEEQHELEVRFRQKRDLWAEEWAMILRDQLAAGSSQ